ncbi:MAG: HAMP domain-containing histidine kinase [Clostridia bacterium]|jgi:signal transduction histidine kinase|nr:HAMP domain-containing histidine kinase [Clostridia bacterium]MCI9413042.1 HAMP domain-containing histidine kinase [Clostridia bacterium]
MENNKISWARVSKNICYFLAPFFGLILIACITGLVIIDTDIEVEETTNYYDTRIFSNNYFNSIYNYLYIPVFVNDQNSKLVTSSTQRLDANSEKEAISTDYEEISHGHYRFVEPYAYDIQENVDINGKKGVIYYDINTNNNFQYLMIDTQKNIAVTNLEHTMRTDSIEEIKQIIGENSIYWNFQKGKVDTNISHLSLEEIRYKLQYKNMNSSNIEEIYTSLINDLPYKDDYALTKFTYDLSMKANTLAPILIPVCIAVLLALGLIVLNGIGKKGKGPGIHLNGFDKVPLEMAFIIGFTIMGIGASCFIAVNSELRAIIFSGVIIGALIIYLACMMLLETVVKRMKTHTLWKTTILYMIGHGIKTVLDNRRWGTKLVLAYGGFCLVGGIATSAMINARYVAYDDSETFWFMVLMALGIGTFIYLFTKMKQFQNIQKALQAIYEGNTNIELNSNELTGVLKQMAIHIEDIAGGLSNAIQQSLKNERQKTELITNVSHDIKTPLTSIINYVDLLKKEEMPNEKAKEYLEILDSKSQRLKRLTEDLVEASKASSGNIKLKKEKININELIKQVSGEFEDKFKARNLEEIMTLPEENVFIEADGRYLYRVLENLYSNASKYAMEGSRIYLDVVPKQTSIVIQMKNVSKEKLNITTEELMQRFVRGDSSRNTEGSGLGLSIASSLTELQGGKFHIYLDGDLFKVTLGFEKLKE